VTNQPNLHIVGQHLGRDAVSPQRRTESIAGRECYQSAEVGVIRQPKPFSDLSAELAQNIGARAGNRTLNLGIKGLSTRRLREDQGGSERLNRTQIYDTTVSESLREDQGFSRSRCQIRCELAGAFMVCSRHFIKYRTALSFERVNVPYACCQEPTSPIALPCPWRRLGQLRSDKQVIHRL
jgi:hypothetical protein